MPAFSSEVTEQILNDQLFAAPYIAAIRAAVVDAEETADSKREEYLAKRERQYKKAESARLDAMHARRRFNEAELKTIAAERGVESMEKTAADEVAKLNAMMPKGGYVGIPSEKLDDAIQQYRHFAHRPRAGLKTIAESSTAAFEKASADRAKARAEWLDVLKAPNDLKTAEKIFDTQLDALVKRHLKPWFVGSVFKNDIDEETGRVRPRALTLPSSADGKADALTLLLLSAEPLIRAAGKRRIGEAWEGRYEFEGALSPAERDKKAAALLKKLREAEELEAAHIRALALAGACPIIRKDIDLKTLFGLEPDPKAKAEFEADAADRRHPNYVAGRGNNGAMTIIRP